MESWNICRVCGKIIPKPKHICLSCTKENDMQAFVSDKKVATNGDWVRTMSNDDLVRFIPQLGCLDPHDLKAFLEKEYKGEQK